MSVKIIEKDSLIGKRIPKMDAPDKAAGKTRYIQDLNLPGQLHAKILRAGRIHARILRIDTSKAKALPGVHAVITAAARPSEKANMPTGLSDAKADSRMMSLEK